jgi:hypothetical protein
MVGDLQQYPDGDILGIEDEYQKAHTVLAQSRVIGVGGEDRVLGGQEGPDRPWSSGLEIDRCMSLRWRQYLVEASQGAQPPLPPLPSEVQDMRV